MVFGGTILGGYYGGATVYNKMAAIVLVLLVLYVIIMFGVQMGGYLTGKTSSFRVMGTDYRP